MAPKYLPILLNCAISGVISAQVAALSASDQIEKAAPSVALVLAERAPGQGTSSIGTAVVLRPHGILLTAYHVVKDAYSLQIRLKTGDTFDEVQLLGVDARRDVAAIKIGASGLPAVAVASLADVKSGDPVTVIANSAALPWSVSTGVVSAVRLSEEVSGPGSGYRLIQFTAPASPGSSGGLVLDSRGRALGLIVGSLRAGQNLNFAVPIEHVSGLADASPAKTFASGSKLMLPGQSLPVRADAKSAQQATPDAPERSEILNPSKDRDYLLRTFKTMYVDARRAQFFGSDQMKAALGRNKDFLRLNIRIVDDPKVADTILSVGYTFAWDYPFELKHQNTSMILISGKGQGPFSGPAGAADVAKQFTNAMKQYRIEPAKK